MKCARFFLRLPAVLLPLGLLLAASGGLPQSAAADEQAPIKLLLHPAVPPRPALKYQLLPTVFERRPGNAAVYYGKVKSEQTAFFADQDRMEKIEHCMDAPLEEVRDAKEVYYPTVIDYLRRAACCETCDWQLPVREDGIETLLPEIQESRQFARLLVAYARKQMAQGDFDAALETLKSGYALGRHVADSPTLVSGLVGIAISNMMSNVVQELIQQPGAPNLYWALTYLPQPMMDMRRNVEGDLLAIDGSFPELRNMDVSIDSPGYWREQLLRVGKRVIRYWEPWASTPDLRKRPDLVAARLLRGYPLAKRALIEQGMTPQEVEAMPVGKVVLIYTSRTYAELRDEAVKCFCLPYWEAQPRLEEAQKRIFEAEGQWREVIPIGAVMLPASQAARTAYVRIDRKIAVLRIVEAVRLYTAAHQGRLPERLTDITEVPIPIDPVTGQPFQYQVRGDVATLEGPPLPSSPLQIEIHLAP